MARYRIPTTKPEKWKWQKTVLKPQIVASAKAFSVLNAFSADSLPRGDHLKMAVLQKTFLAKLDSEA